MITRKNYFATVCEVYAILVLTKLILEAIMGKTDGNYSENIIYMFVVCCVATLILSLQQIFTKIPLLFMIIFQYILLLIFIAISIHIMSFFSPVSQEGCKDMLLSISIPYVFFAILYYISYFRDVKKANLDIQKIRTLK